MKKAFITGVTEQDGWCLAEFLLNHFDSNEAIVYGGYYALSLADTVSIHLQSDIKRGVYEFEG